MFMYYNKLINNIKGCVFFTLNLWVIIEYLFFFKSNKNRKHQIKSDQKHNKYLKNYLNQTSKIYTKY